MKSLFKAFFLIKFLPSQSLEITAALNSSTARCVHFVSENSFAV